MKPIINLYDIKKRRVLSSRDTAREIAPLIVNAMSQNGNGENLTVDLADIRTVAPSFFDELLHVISESAAPAHPVIDIENTTDRQFARFRAVCRVHGLTTENVAPNHWRITKA